MKEFVSSVQATCTYLEGEDQGKLWAKLKHKGSDIFLVLYRMLIPLEIKNFALQETQQMSAFAYLYKVKKTVSGVILT
jgi:hypothetical protein